VIRNFMVFVGPISSIFDFLTFYVLLHFFAHRGAVPYRLVCRVAGHQILVVFRHPHIHESSAQPPSIPLLVTCLAVVAIGMYLPFSPFATMLGFTPLPLSYFAFVAAATAVYLLLVEAAKRILIQRATARAHKEWKALAATT